MTATVAALAGVAKEESGLASGLNNRAPRKAQPDLLLRNAARPAENEERQRQADPGEESAGEEGGLEALVQRDERVGAFVCGQAVVGARDGDRSGDSYAERGADLEGGARATENRDRRRR